jgi:FG-GAP repeat
MRRVTSILTVILSLTSFWCFAASAQRAAETNAWAQLAELTPTNRVNQDWFGVSSAVSGNTLVVGAFDGNIEQTGTAYVYVKPSSGWGNMTQTATLTPSDGGEGFGTFVAISGDTIIVGAANASNQYPRTQYPQSLVPQSLAPQTLAPQSLAPQTQGPGAAYIFVKPASGWTDMTETAKLTASDGAGGDAFGYNVSISGNTAAVGALFAHSGAGAAYVFVKPASGWSKMTQTAELTASDATTFDNMGSVAISGNTVVTGAYGHNNFMGAAYVFVKPSTGWKDMTQRAELKSTKANQIYGFSVATNGKTAIVGAVGAQQGIGAAFVYVKPANGWKSTSKFTAKLTASSSSGVSGLSQGMSISGKRIVLGAPGTTVGSNSGQGAVLVYHEPKTGWKTTSGFAAELTASDGAANDNLGVSAAVNGSTITGGATKSGPPGEAYVFGK